MSSETLVQINQPSEIVRVFPARTHWTPTDELAFVGFPPLFRPGTRKTPVRVSVTFTWHLDQARKIAEAWRAFYDDVLVGGPATGDIGGEFTPGRFLKAGCTITSRGCPKACPWCDVPKRMVLSGMKKITGLRDIQPGWIVQDDNLLACSDDHVARVFEMLREQKRRIFFNGGLDKHFLTEFHRKLFDTIRIGELWFACDRGGPNGDDMKHLERASKLLDGIPLRKRRCYTMIGFDPDETLRDAEARVERVLELGFMPYCQLYQSHELKVYPLEWRQVHRKWARPAAYMSQAHEAAV